MGNVAQSFPRMKEQITAIIVATVMMTLTGTTVGAPLFCEDFDDNNLYSGLEENESGTWSFSSGSATVSNEDDRNYIRTTATDWNQVDSFVAKTTVTVSNHDGGNNNGNGGAFLGIGDAALQADFYDTPTNAVNIELFSETFTADTVNDYRGAIYDGNENGESAETFFGYADDAAPGNGTHQARLIKHGNTLTFEVDEDFNGTYTADFSDDISLTASRLDHLETPTAASSSERGIRRLHSMSSRFFPSQPASPSCFYPSAQACLCVAQDT